MWKRWRVSKEDQNLRAQYNKACAEYKRAIRNREIELEKNIISENNPGAFYNFVNKKIRSVNNVGALNDEAGNTVVDDRGRANILNRYFYSVYTVDDGNEPVTVIPNSQHEHVIDYVHFDESKIIRAAKSIKSKGKTTCDLEGYPVVFLSRLIAILCVPLTFLYNSFMSIGKIPTNWKKAIVTPIFKNGLPSVAKNYRPISCTSNFCKLMERVIVREVSESLSNANLLNPAQHGFLRMKSTTTNLIETLSDWNVILENNSSSYVTAIYIDFQKAFDSVSHKKLLSKLKCYGISGKLHELIEDFLSGRTQMTKVNYELSDVTQVTSGVVQGSCLGPLLFVIFVNDLSVSLSRGIITKLFADDLKLFTKIITHLDEFHLQHNLNIIKTWSHDFQLPISIPKCSVMHIQHKTTKMSNLPSYFFGMIKLQEITCVKDLGVLFDNRLTFSNNINSIVHKASCRSRLIHKSFTSRQPKLLVHAFTTYVRPILEYCSPIWSPSSIKDITSIESVQRRFTKKLSGLFYCTYDDRLKNLGLERLEVRRIRADLILCYKILFGLYKTTLKIEFQTYSKTRGHQFKLKLPVIRTDTQKFFFIYRTAKIWNELPTYTDFSSLQKF